MAGKTAVIPVERIPRLIFIARRQKVILDEDLAALYQVETKILNRAVKRNRDRFPEDFMFRLAAAEVADLRFQTGTSRWGGRRYLPYVFTEQGVAMLSSVLHSRRAVQVNIEIMRAFVRLRQMLAGNAELARKLAALERKYDSQFKVVFDASCPCSVSNVPRLSSYRDQAVSRSSIAMAAKTVIRTTRRMSARRWSGTRARVSGAVDASRQLAAYYGERRKWAEVNPYMQCLFTLSKESRQSSPGEQFRRR